MVGILRILEQFHQQIVVGVGMALMLREGFSVSHVDFPAPSFAPAAAAFAGTLGVTAGTRSPASSDPALREAARCCIPPEND